MYVGAAVSDAYSLKGLSRLFPISIVRIFFDDSMLENWPSFNPHNFSQFKPNEPTNPSKMTPGTYCPTHDRTLPPPDQVLVPESRNILLRHFYQNAEEKLRHKRGSCENLPPERPSKMSRASSNSI